MKEKLKVGFIGSGNLAWHLAPALQKQGHELVSLIGRSGKSTEELADKLNVNFSLDIRDISDDTDILFLSVNDKSIKELVTRIKLNKTLIVHTSGSIPMQALQTLPEHGVFYPLQTFSKQRELEFHNIPVFIEANSDHNSMILKNLALQLSHTVRECNSENRKYLHLAAVFACNFTNHMYAIAENLLENKGFDYDVLSPLISETLQKAGEIGPKIAQTGPALRNDKNIIENHLALLSEYPEYQKIYSFVSKSILNFNKRKL